MSAVVTFGRMVRFSHTIFAMPFALAAAAIAARGHGVGPGRIALIVVAMAGARTAAMGFNRIADRHIDARNPRTSGRELPSGRVSLAAAWALTTASAAAFVAAATVGGASALGLRSLGSLGAGKRPGILDVSLGDLAAPLESLVREPRPELRWVARA